MDFEQQLTQIRENLGGLQLRELFESGDLYRKRFQPHWLQAQLRLVVPDEDTPRLNRASETGTLAWLGWVIRRPPQCTLP